MEPKVSVIVPVYNVEKYLAKCINSILNQTYRNLELILVNDGSTDDSFQIIDSYLLKDKRTKLLYKKNSGLSAARNAGIEIARGQYICLVDADDYIHTGMIENLLEIIEQTDSDIAVSGFIRVEEEQAVNEPLQERSIRCYNNIEALNNLFNDLYVLTVISCNKLYKKYLFEGIKYPEGKIHEDEYTTYKLINKADKIVYLNLDLYYYVQRDDSIMGEGFNIRNLDCLDAFKERTNFFLELQYDDLFNKSANHYLIKIIIYYYKVLKLRKYNQVANQLRTRFFEEYKKLSKENLKIKHRIVFLSFFINPLICKIVLYIRNKYILLRVRKK